MYTLCTRLAACQERANKNLIKNGRVRHRYALFSTSSLVLRVSRAKECQNKEPESSVDVGRRSAPQLATRITRSVDVCVTRVMFTAFQSQENKQNPKTPIPMSILPNADDCKQNLRETGYSLNNASPLLDFMTHDSVNSSDSSSSEPHSVSVFEGSQSRAS